MKLTDEMHDAVKNSEVGRYIDRLIVADVANHPEFAQGWRGNVIQALWEAFMSECKVQDEINALHEMITKFVNERPVPSLEDKAMADKLWGKKSFREIKQEIKHGV